jgi:hypothetical protein
MNMRAVVVADCPAEARTHLLVVPIFLWDRPLDSLGSLGAFGRQGSVHAIEIPLLPH